jgi:hypothetical protein
MVGFCNALAFFSSLKGRNIRHSQVPANFAHPLMERCPILARRSEAVDSVSSTLECLIGQS